jgi:hypothetical protein
MIRTAEGGVHTNTGGSDASGTILPTNQGGADGLRASTADHRPTAANSRSADEIVPAPAVRPHQARTTNTDPEGLAGRSPEEINGPRNQRGTSTGTGRHDPRRTAIWRGSLWLEDAVSKSLELGSQSSPGRPPNSRGQTPAISRLPGLFRVRLNSVPGLHRSTPDGHTTQPCQLSRRTFKDVVYIQPLEGNRRRPDLATPPGGWNDRAGRPISFYTTPGSSF